MTNNAPAQTRRGGQADHAQGLVRIAADREDLLRECYKLVIILLLDSGRINEVGLERGCGFFLRSAYELFGLLGTQGPTPCKIGPDTLDLGG